MPKEAFEVLGEVAVTCGSLEYEMASFVTWLDHNADADRLLSYSDYLSRELNGRLAAWPTLIPSWAPRSRRGARRPRATGRTAMCCCTRCTCGTTSRTRQP